MQLPNLGVISSLVCHCAYSADRSNWKCGVVCRLSLQEADSADCSRNFDIDTHENQR
ncbi:unnamed protein product, partial [Nesidiocoris tenuis]